MPTPFDTLDQDAAEVIFETLCGGDLFSYQPPNDNPAVDVYAVLDKSVDFIAPFSEVVERGDTISLLNQQVTGEVCGIITINGVDYRLEAILSNDGVETTWRVTQQ